VGTPNKISQQWLLPSLAGRILVGLLTGGMRCFRPTGSDAHIKGAAEEMVSKAR
jgi:hypothetical protein